jgi:hypothetical protein
MKMKNYIKFIAVCLTAFIISCESEEPIFDNVNGQTAIQFTQAAYSTSIPVEGLTLSIPVLSTTVSGEARSFNITVNDATNPAEFTVGSLTIPADSYEGVLSVAFDYAAITGNDGDLKTATFTIETSGETTAAFKGSTTVDYFREIICNDTTFTINTDFYAGETGFSITDDATGNVVYTMPALGNARQTFTAAIYLADGCYTATITDSYGDGQLDGTVTGNYTITCSIITFASGGGAFASSQSRSFCVNQ